MPTHKVEALKATSVDEHGAILDVLAEDYDEAKVERAFLYVGRIL